jgi:hypothetical protein
MPTAITVPELRARLARAGWDLTELAGGPWVIYGFNGDAELCVMGKTRDQAWRRADDAGKPIALASPPAGSKMPA